MPTTEGTAQPTIDWRDWVAFLGYVLAAAVVVSVMLASVVLVISMQAEGPKLDPKLESAAPAELRPVASEIHRAAPETRETRPASPPAVVKAAPAPALAPAKTAPSPTRIEVTAESLRADKPIAPSQPAPMASDPAMRSTGAAGEPAATQALPIDAAEATQRIEITSESLRAETPMGQAQTEPVLQAPASAQPAAAAQQAAPAAQPGTVAQAAQQPAAPSGSAW